MRTAVVLVLNVVRRMQGFIGGISHLMRHLRLSWVAYSFTMAAFVFVPSSANAQFARAYGFKVSGVLAEQAWKYSTAEIAAFGNPGRPSKSILGFGGTLFVDFFRSPNVSLLAELQYHQKRFTITIDQRAPADNVYGGIDLGPSEIQRRYQFLALTVMPKLRADCGSVTPFIAIGPSGEVLLSHGDYNQVGKFELAVVIAVGAEVSLGSAPRLIGDVRFIPALPNADDENFLVVQNKRFEFSLGLAF